MVFNSAHLHLMLNHVPVFFAFFGSLLLVLGMMLRQPVLRFVSYAIIIAGGAGAIAAYVTGSLAEDAIAHIAGVFENAIDPHEDAGKITLALLLVAALAAGVAWARDARNGAPRWLTGAVLALGVAGFLAGGYAAYLGGLIHHQEIRLPHAGGTITE